MFQVILYKEMVYHCVVCDETNKIKIENKQHTHIEFEKCIRIKHTIENPDFVDIDIIFNDYSTNHDKTLAESFKPITDKLENINESTKQLKEVFENTSSENEKNQMLLLLKLTQINQRMKRLL